MKPLAPIFNFVLSWPRYASTTSRSGCTKESKLKTKSTDASGIIDNERPSFRTQRMCESLAKRCRHSRMRRKIVPVHWPAELPHGSDHSSPTSYQSYDIDSRTESWLQR